MKKPKSYLGVMVSSTFADLVEHRKIVSDLIHTNKLLPINMEAHGGPRVDLNVVDHSLEMVEDGAAYIAIVGHRYGQIPDSPERNPDGLSLTELEFNHAEELGRPILLFLMADDHASAAAGRDSRQMAFRERVKYPRQGDRIARVYAEFNSPEDLRHKAAVAIAQLRTYLESLRINDLGDQWPQALPFEPYMAEKRELFAGRAWLFDEIDEWLTAGAGRALVIRADFGVGKSALVAEYVHRHRHDTVIAWHFCRHDTQRTLRPAAFVQSLAAQLADSLPGYRQAIESDEGLLRKLTQADADPADALDAAVLTPLCRLPPPDGARLLVVDSLNEALEVDPAEAARLGTIVDLLVSRAGSFPPWLRILATSRPLKAELGTRLKTAFNLREINAEDARNAQDLREYAHAALKSSPAIRRHLAAAAITPEVFTDWLVQKSGGKFLYVVHVLRDVAQGNLALQGRDSLPPGMDAFYQSSYVRRFGAAAQRYHEVRQLLGIMCCVAEPMLITDLAEIMGATPAAVEGIQAQLPDFARIHDGRLFFGHASLREWLTLDDPVTGLARAGRFAVDLPASRAHLLAWARQRLQAGTAPENSYLLRNLAAHLPGDEDRYSVYTALLLERFDWSQARLAGSGVAGLLEDSAWIRRHREHPLFQTLLGSSERNVRRSASHWRAQVLGRLGVADACIGLDSLASSAAGFQPPQPAANDMLLPLTRSLGLVAGQDQVLEGHSESISALAVLPDGRLISGSRDRSLRIWRLNDLVQGGSARVLKGHRDTITGIAVLPDGRVVTGSAAADRRLRVWDLVRGEPTLTVRAGGGITALALLRDGRAVTGLEDGTLRIWELAHGEAVQKLVGHSRAVTSVTVLADGRVVSGSDDHTLRVWDLARGTSSVLKGHSGSVTALAVLPDGRVVSGSDDYTLRVWDLARGGTSSALPGHSGSVTALTVLPDGRVISGSTDRRLRVWDLGSGTSQVIEGHGDFVRALTVLHDGRVVSGSRDRTLRVWNLARGAAPQVRRIQDEPVNALAMLPDGRTVAGRGDGRLEMWDSAHRGAPPLQTYGSSVNALAVVSGVRVVAGCADGTLRVRDLTAEGEAPWALPGHRDSVRALAVLPDGRVVSASRRALRVWDLARRAASQVLEEHGHSDWVRALAVLPDGRVVSSGSDDRTLRVWDLSGAAAPQVFTGHRDTVRALAVLPDGRVVSGSTDCTLRVWDLARGGAPEVLEGHSDTIRALVALPDGRVVSGGDDRSLRVWQPAGDGSFEGYEGFIADTAVLCLAASASLIAAGCVGGAVHFLSFSSSYSVPAHIPPA